MRRVSRTGKNDRTSNGKGGRRLKSRKSLASLFGISPVRNDRY